MRASLSGGRHAGEGQAEESRGAIEKGASIGGRLKHPILLYIDFFGYSEC
jgi:hypothetical protein